MDLKLLRKLTQAWGVSGREKAVRNLILEEIRTYADEIHVDALGSVIALKKGSGGGKRIMLCAHMDELGLQVKKILPDGRLKVCKVGWVWTCSLYNDKVLFQNGTVGIVGCDGSVEDAKNDVGKLYVDIGCASAEEAAKLVNIGDYCSFVGSFYELANRRVCSKSLDDRGGCCMLIEALRNQGSSVNDVYYVFSVQEEIGCRGAVAASAYVKPDIGVSIDVTPDHFYPCDLEGSNEVGKGIGVCVGNPSAVLDEELVDEMIRICETNQIPYQRDVMDRGGTDAASINLSGEGVRVCGISLVDRYPHSQSSLVSIDDMDAGVSLIGKFIQSKFSF